MKTLYDRLSDGGEIVMPFDKVPWSRAYGYIKDKFGVYWMVSVYEKRDE